MELESLLFSLIKSLETFKNLTIEEKVEKIVFMAEPYEGY